MKKVITSIVLVFGLFTNCLAQENDKKLQKAFEALKTAALANDFEAQLQLAHPALVAAMGGRDKYIELVKRAIKGIEDEGGKLLDVAFVSVLQRINTGTEMQYVVQKNTKMKFKTKTFLMTGYSICFSADLGQRWTFVDAQPEKLEMLKKIIPSLSSQLIIPKNEIKLLTDE